MLRSYLFERLSISIDGDKHQFCVGDTHNQHSSFEMPEALVDCSLLWEITPSQKHMHRTSAKAPLAILQNKLHICIREITARLLLAGVMRTV